MRNIKLTIEYDGTNYCGWQKQKNGPSIQEHIEKALQKIFKKHIKVIGAARTDSGVHARGQAANFKIDTALPLKKIQKALNGNLPSDIRIIGIASVAKDFNAQFQARGKLYRYTIYNRFVKSPFYDRSSLHIPYKLNLASMRKAKKPLLGKHDFSSFKGSKGASKTSIRTIKKISIKTHNDFIMIDIEANGFLYNMVRNIIGTLMEIGRGRLKPNSMQRILSERDRTKAGPTAPARGLTLMEVKY